MKEPATLMHSIRQRLLAHFEKSALFAPDDPAMEAVSADSGQLLYAPVSGRIRALTRIKDPVFSSEVLGKGCAIEPSCGEVVAPADGIVEKIAKTHHAISLQCDNGLKVLIHVGMDTVEMKGNGFTSLVKEGTKVKAGTPLLKVDLDAIRAAGHPTATAIIVTNGDDLPEMSVAAAGDTAVGVPLLKFKA